MPVRILFTSGPVLVTAAALSTLGFIRACSQSGAENPRTSSALVQRPPKPAAPISELPRPDPKNLPKLSADLPVDLALPASDSASRTRQDSADIFSWSSFLALNWPATPDGTPIPSTPPGLQGDNTTVWETWPEAAEVFLPESVTSAAWDSLAPRQIHPATPRSPPAQPRLLARTGKDLTGLVPASHLGPLIDQNGRHVRLESRLNRPVFETVMAHRLSRGSEPTSAATAGPLAFPPGSIRIQAAWKILSAAEIAAGRFHTAEALLPPPGAPSGAAYDTASERVVVGLVGLHIARKTPSFPGWIWSTFEHVDNCPTIGEPVDRAAYNFYDKTTPSRPANQPPSPPWDPASVAPPSHRSQIIRQTPIPLATRSVSAAYQAALRAINPTSVWQYYQLVGTQAAAPSGVSLSSPESGPAASSVPEPRPLGNTAMEPYLAASTSPVASCLDCHAKAATPSGASADTFFLPRPRQ